MTHLIPIFEDNYVFVIETSTGAVVIDPGDGEPVREFLMTRGLDLSAILITHHHADHVGGIETLIAGRKVQIVAPAVDRGRWSFASDFVADGDQVRTSGLTFEVLAVPGHTIDHVAYFNRERGEVFVGDALFGLGCGRLFEGSASQMRESLEKLKLLPDDTRVYCAHEYTERNLRFVEAEFPTLRTTEGFEEHGRRIRARRAGGQPTVPLLLKDEKRFNPFLTSDSVAEFHRRRALRDIFRG